MFSFPPYPYTSRKNYQPAKDSHVGFIKPRLQLFNHTHLEPKIMQTYLHFPGQPLITLQLKNTCCLVFSDQLQTGSCPSVPPETILAEVMSELHVAIPAVSPHLTWPTGCTLKTLSSDAHPLQALLLFGYVSASLAASFSP